jgi:GNAT superfamily N-acetyltransferase
VRNEIAHRTLWAVFRWNRLWVLEQDVSGMREVPPPAGVTIEQFHGEWSELGEIAPRRELHAFEQAAAKGRTCLVARREGRPIGYTWTSFAIEPAVERFDIPLPSDTAYGWKLYVVPSERNSGTGTALVSARLGFARAHGRTRGWRVIAPANAPSLRTATKVSHGGPRRIGTVYHLQLGPLKLTRFVPLTAEQAQLRRGA